MWGFSDAELIPLRVYMVAQKIGGQVLGAFEGSRWAFRGCAAGIPTCTEVEVAREGSISVTDSPGTGYRVREDLIEKFTVRKDVIGCR